MEELPTLVQLGQLTLSGLGGVGVILLFLGKVIPKTTVDTLLAARDAEINRANERGDEWQKAYESERHVTELIRDQNRELIEVARTVEHVMESLQLVVEGRTGA